MLRFDPAIGLYADEVADVREEVARQWQAAFAAPGRPALDVRPETPQGQLIDSQTAAIADKDSELLYLASMFNPLTAQGIWQDALGAIYFLTRKLAIRSQVACLCTGAAGTVIPAGAIVRDENNVQWQNVAPATIGPQGTVTSTFACLEPGQVSVGAGAVNKIETIVPGFDAVTNPAPAIVGRLEETQGEFETRRYASVMKNAHGSLGALYGSLANLEGVIDCAVLENDTPEPVVKAGVTIPGHSVCIAIVGGDEGQIAETIYRKKDMGCGTFGNTEVSWTAADIPGQPIYRYRILRPASVSVYVNVVITPLSGAVSDVEALIREAIISNFNGGGGATRVGLAQTVYASRFFCPVLSVGGIALVSLTLGKSADALGASVVFNADEEPVIAAENITITMREADNA